MKPCLQDDDLMISMLDKCKQSQPVIQRMIETTTNDDGFLFEALNLHDNLEQIISKYEKKMESAVEKPELSQKLPEVSETSLVGTSNGMGQVEVKADEAETLDSLKGHNGDNKTVDDEGKKLA